MARAEIIFNRDNCKEGILIVRGNQFRIDGMSHEFAHWEMDQENGQVTMTNRILGTKEIGHQDGDLYYFKEFGVEREHKNPMIAFAQLMWHIV